MQEAAQDAGHAEAPPEQCDGGPEELRPGQAAVAAVRLSVAAELPRHPDPLGTCMAQVSRPCPWAAPLSPWGLSITPHLAAWPPSRGSQSEPSGAHLGPRPSPLTPLCLPIALCTKSMARPVAPRKTGPIPAHHPQPPNPSPLNSLGLRLRWSLCLDRPSQLREPSPGKTRGVRTSARAPHPQLPPLSARVVQPSMRGAAPSGWGVLVSPSGLVGWERVAPLGPHLCPEAGPACTGPADPGRGWQVPSPWR